MNGFALLAGLVVVAHLAFVVFAAAGGLAVLRWPRLAWAHLPAAGWAIYIELTAGICPLTPLENALRVRAGLDDYSGDFVARYLFPVLYPDGLTPAAQTIVGLSVLGITVVVYGMLLGRWVQRRRRAGAFARSRA